MENTLKAAREYLYNDRSWSSSGKTLDARVNTCIFRALREIAGEVPEALEPQTYKTRVRKTIDGDASTVLAKVKKTTDYLVLEFRSPADTYLTAGATSWRPTVDGTWNGIMWLEITDPDGRVRRRQTREWWSVVDGSDTAYYVSLDIPWYDTGSSLMSVRVYQPAFYLPADVTEVLGPARVADTSGDLVGHISAGTAHREALPEAVPGSFGPPVSFWRGDRVQIPSPTTPPRLSAPVDSVVDGKNNYVKWLGPVQDGKWRICYTYAWGQKDSEWGESTAKMSDPMWESAPSPVATFDHATESDIDGSGNTQGRAMTIECDNLEEMLDFMGDPKGIVVGASYPSATAPLRYGRSGVKIRVYAARDVIYTTHGPRTSSLGATPNVAQAHRMNRAEADGKFYLLAEVEPLNQDTVLSAMTTPVYQVSSFTWQGILPSPDPSRQLQRPSGYYGWQYYPLPDQDYDLEVNVLRQPKELVNDNDVVPIKEDAFEAFIELALSYMCRLDGADMQGEMKHRGLYRTLVRRYRSMHGDNDGVVHPKGWAVGQVTQRLSLFTEA